jgi:hypothetical protein
MPLQSVPHGKRLHTTPNHQLILEHIRSSLDTHLIQAGLIHLNPAAHPPVWVNPAIVGRDVMLEVGNAMVLLGVVASDDRELGVGSLVDRRGAIVTLQVAGGVATLSRVRTPLSVRRRKTLLELGGGRTSTRERLDWVTQTERRPSASSASGRERSEWDGTPCHRKEWWNWLHLRHLILSYRGGRTKRFGWRGGETTFALSGISKGRHGHNQCGVRRLYIRG